MSVVIVIFIAVAFTELLIQHVVTVLLKATITGSATLNDVTCTAYLTQLYITVATDNTDKHTEHSSENN